MIIYDIKLMYYTPTYFSIRPFLKECLKFTIVRVSASTHLPLPFLAWHGDKVRVHLLGLGTKDVALEGLKVGEESRYSL